MAPSKRTPIFGSHLGGRTTRLVRRPGEREAPVRKQIMFGSPDRTSLNGHRRVDAPLEAALSEGQPPGCLGVTRPQPKSLMVSSTGGHLAELLILAGTSSSPQERFWVTFDSVQARSVLAHEQLHTVREIAPRAGLVALAALPRALRLLHATRPYMVVSTGAAIALPYLTAARILGIPAHYVESAARIDGPSVTGRLLQRLPGVQLHQQEGDTWSARWQRTGSVFDGFAVGSTDIQPHGGLRVLVLLGTMNFPFERIVEQVVGLLNEPGIPLTVVWQAGHTEIPQSAGTVYKFLPEDSLAREARLADVIVSHAGVGSALLALCAGKCPVLFPRSVRFGEHVDDHQASLGAALTRRGLALTATQLTRELLARAAARQVTVAPATSGPWRPFPDPVTPGAQLQPAPDAGRRSHTSAEGPSPAQRGGRLLAAEKNILPLRIMMLTDSLEVGGLERVVVTLSNALARDGHHVHVVAEPDGELWDDLSPGIIRVGAPPRNTIFQQLRYLVWLRHLLRSQRFDLVHTHQRGVGLLTVLARGRLGVRVVEHVHNVFPSATLTAKVSFRGDHLIACGPAIADMLTRDFHRPTSRVTTVANSVPDLAGGLLPTPFAAGLTDVPTILVVARATEVKDPHRFIEVVAQLNKREIAVKAQWVGGGDLLDCCRAEVTARGITGLTFLGGRSDVAPYFAGSDIVMLTSRSEGLPLVLLEGACFGRPLLAPRVGSCSAVVENGENGFLFEPTATPSDVADLLEQLVLPANLWRMGRASREKYVAEFQPAGQAKKLEEVYQHALQRT